MEGAGTVYKTQCSPGLPCELHTSFLLTRGWREPDGLSIYHPLSEPHCPHLCITSSNRKMRIESIATLMSGLRTQK